MKTPHEKYMHDPKYHNLVNALQSYIEAAEFTPSEVREAAMYACIRYEENRRRYTILRGETDDE